MMGPPALLVAAKDSLLSDSGLFPLLGGAAAALALLGLLLLLPLYISHRREVVRLRAWMDHEPEAGTTEFRAVPAPGATAATGPAGRMTPAERVTSERPALARITTAEHAALQRQQTPFLRRALERGPRHPLVLTILALLVAAGVFVAAAQLIRSSSDESGGGGMLDRASVQVVVVNAAASSGVGGDVGENLAADGFDVTGFTAASDSAKRSAVMYAEGARPSGNAVARSLGLPPAVPFDAAAEAAAAGADVIVIAGKDAQTIATGGKS